MIGHVRHCNCDIDTSRLSIGLVYDKGHFFWVVDGEVIEVEASEIPVNVVILGEGSTDEEEVGEGKG